MTDIATVNLTLNSAPTNTTISVAGPQGTPGVIQSIVGTAHEVIVTMSGAGNSIATLSTPQTIDTTSSPTFAGLTLTASSTTALNLKSTATSGGIAQMVIIANSSGAGTSKAELEIFTDVQGGNSGWVLQSSGTGSPGVNNTLSLWGVVAGTFTNLVQIATSGALTLFATTASTSTTTGALIVDGGAGIAGAVYAGSIQNTPIGSTTKSSGAFTTLTANGAVTLTAGTASTTTTTGTLVVTGGVGVSGLVNSTGVTVFGSGASLEQVVTTDFTTGGNVFHRFNDVNGNGAYVGFGGSGTHSFDIYNYKATPLNFVTSSSSRMTIDSTGFVTINPNIASTSTTTGGLVVTGGVGIGGDTYHGGILNVAGMVTLQSGLEFSNAPSISAAGTTQGTATVLTLDTSVVTTCASGAGVVLPSGIGREITVINRGANALLVYPPSGASIDGASANAATSVPINGWLTVDCSSATQYYAIDPVTVGGADISITQSNNGTLTVADTSTLSTVTGRGATTGTAVSITNSTASTTTTTGALIVTGGVGVGGNISSGGYVSALRFVPTASTVPANGMYLPTTNELGFAVNSTGQVFLNSSALVVGAGTYNPLSLSLSSAAGTIFSNNNVITTTYPSLGFNTYYDNTNSAWTATVTNTYGNYIRADNTGNLVVLGVGNTTTAGSSVASTTHAIASFQDGSASSSTGGFNIARTTTSSSTTTGSLTVGGGAGIVGAVYAGSFNGPGTGLTGTASSLTVGTATNIAGGATDSIPYQTGVGTTGFIAAGTNGYILTMVSGAPAWAASSATNATNLSGGAAGELPYQSGVGTTLFSAAGSSGQVLVSGGTGSPTWTASPTFTAPALGTPASGTLTNCTFPTLNQNTTGNAATAGGFTPTATSGTANRIVVADASGYINNNYFNSTDGGTTGTAQTVSAIMCKASDNYLRATTAASIATFLSGSTMNISGSSTSCSGNAASASVVSNSTGRTDATAYPVVWNNTSSTSEMYSCSAVTIQSSTGTVNATAFVVSSDRKLKTNIRTIINAEEIIQSLNGVKYDWKANDKASAGVIAQDVEVLMPELVETNDDGTKAVNYNGLIGVLIEEVKALRKEVNALRGG